jgi:hypothetical protein
MARLEPRRESPFNQQHPLQRSPREVTLAPRELYALCAKPYTLNRIT